MARTDGDSWDLASSVGATATLVATGRAIASTDPHGLINDPFAAPLVRAVGIEAFTMMVDGTLNITEIAPDAASRVRANIDEMAVRTKFFDDYFLAATERGVRQAVILASGLDARAYRLPWPAGTVVYEIDQPQVIGAKTAAMEKIGATASAIRRTVAIDLREDWPAALRAAGFDPALPTAWSAEGLLAYLPPEAQDRLFDNITALSAPGSRLATEFHPDFGAAVQQRTQAVADRWRQHGFDVDLGSLWYTGDRNSPIDYLAGTGWSVSSRPRPELFDEYGRVFPDTADAAPQRNSLAVTAIRK